MNRYVLALSMLVLVLIGALVFQHRKLGEQQIRIDGLLRQLSDGTTAIPTTVSSPEALATAAAAAGIDIKNVQKDADKSGSTVRGATTATSKTPGKKETGLGSTEEKPRQDPPPMPPASAQCPEQSPYMRKAQTFALDEPLANKTAIPWGKTTFEAWKTKPWSIEVFPRAYQAGTVVATNEEGIVSAYSKLRVEVEGKTYDLPITNAGTTSTLPPSRFRFNPSLFLGATMGAIVRPFFSAEFAPAIQFGLLSYGPTKLAPDYAFLLFGAGYASLQKEPIVTFSPVTVNLGTLLPVVDNVHLAPTVGLGLDGSILILAGVHAKL